MRRRAVFVSDASGRCELELGGYRHKCRLDRLSPSGVRVNCLGFLHETLPGDKAVLHLQTDPDSIPCRVKQIAAAKIELQFV